jgi:hypothetical protein
MLKSQFLVAFQNSQANCLWIDFSKFWQFWAEFATLAMVENMTEARLKT